MKTNIAKTSRIVHLASAGKRIVFTLALAMGVITSYAQTPDTFTWIGGASGSWDAVGVWTPTVTSRIFPEIAGDMVVTTNATTITMTTNVTVSGISVSGGTLTLLNTGVVTQTFASASASVTNKISVSVSNINSGDSASGDNLVMDIVDNLLFLGYHNNGYVSMFVWDKIIGGSVEDPISLLFEVSGNQYSHFRVHLMNANNTYRGDVYIGAAGALKDGDVSLYLGYGSTQGKDSMLGNSDNKIILRNKRPALCVTGGYSEGLKRRVLGTGTVQGRRVNTGYASITYPDPIILGDGSSLEPSVEFSNPIGKITVAGSTITTHTNSQIRINVTETTKDVVAFSGSSAFTYTGKVLMEPLEEIPVGTSWPIITVTAATKAFTFNPSYTTPFYSFQTTGNASAGWVVTATRQVDTTLYPAVQNLPTTLIAETNATLHADVISVAPDGEATLRAYFGTVDQVSDFGAWDHVEAYAATVTTLGAYSLKLNTLNVNTTYYVRHSVSNSTGESMSSDVTSFTTRPWNTPDTFTWVSTNADWHAEGVWTINTLYERRTPEFKGDKIIINMVSTYGSSPGVSRTLNLTNDVTISSMTINDGYGLYANISATNGPATLTFDADASGTNQIYSSGQLAGMTFGNNTGDYGLTMELKQPLLFLRNSSWGLNVQFYAAIIGGSEENLSDIIFNTMGGEYCNVYHSLLNTNNTFRGDVYLGDAQARGASMMLTIGNNSMPARNEMLGDAANQVVLRNNSTLRYNPGAESVATVERHVKGHGTLNSTKAMSLAATAVLEPQSISGIGYGTNTVSATAFTADANAQYVLDLKATGGQNDALVFNVTSPLTLTGMLELVPESGERVAAGTSWDVITVSATATSFTSALTKTTGYILTTTGDDTTGWTVTATATSLGTLLIVR
ncbi:MAG: hypothetical protein PF692_01445 [Kiritimatiellae bacterium]|nr:hypothetical protein [Kiritimatiellia bacterium]